MERIGRRVPTGARAARWMLLVAVLAGLFGMHVLTAEHGSNRHSMLPVASIAAHDVMGGHSPTPVNAVPSEITGMIPAGTSAGVDVQAMPGTPAPGVGHWAMAGCILFLVVGGFSLLLALLRHLHGAVSPGGGRLAGAAVSDMRRRGPPGRWPRLALCVIRV